MNKPIIIAHRGASKYERENTIKSFKLAESMGADFVELDVHLTRDKELIVFHPFYLKGERIIDLTLERLKRIDGDIPTLKEVLKEIDIKINIEIKGGEKFYPGIVDILLDILKDYPTNRFIVSSFDIDTLRILKEKRKEISVESLLFYPYGKEFKKFLSGINPFFLFINRNFVERVHSKGLTVKPYTVNSKTFMRKFIKIGVDGIFTDVPDILKEVIEEKL